MKKKLFPQVEKTEKCPEIVFNIFKQCIFRNFGVIKARKWPPTNSAMSRDIINHHNVNAASSQECLAQMYNIFLIVHCQEFQ
jgi:hypothetical protein